MNVATSSLFSQLLSLMDRNRFAKLVRETGSERRSKGVASWHHFIAMVFCQLARAVSRTGCVECGSGCTGDPSGCFRHRCQGARRSRARRSAFPHHSHTYHYVKEDYHTILDLAPLNRPAHLTHKKDQCPPDRSVEPNASPTEAAGR